MKLSAQAIDERLQRTPRAVLATLRADGSASLVPVVFARVGDVLWSPIDGKPKRGATLARLANVARDSRVALLLDHYDADWSLLWWLRVEGRARVLPSGPGAGPSEELVQAESALRAKYAQYASTPLYHAEAVLLRIEIDRLTSWAASEAAVCTAEGRAG